MRNTESLLPDLIPRPAHAVPSLNQSRRLNIKDTKDFGAPIAWAFHRAGRRGRHIRLEY